jgi:CRISPR-associated protein (TIGR02710 family)
VDTRRIDTLYESMRTSMGIGSWDRIVLLPSSDTQSLARELVEYVADRHPVPLQITIGTELKPGDFEHEDRCFAHFDAALAALIEGGIEPDLIVFDYTRGTKAMSAAAVLACVSRGVNRIRYVTGQRGSDGQVLAGTERILDGSTQEAVFRREIDRVLAFFRTGQFVAAEQTLAPLIASNSDEARKRQDVESGIALARFWGHWDRFHYRAAHKLAAAAESAGAVWGHIAPASGNLEMIDRLVRNPQPGPPEHYACEVHRDYAQALVGAHQNLAADLIQNAWRRWVRGDWEDCLIRAFRILELVGHLRLCRRGILASALCLKDPVLQEWLRLRPPEMKLYRNELAQPMIAELLEHLNDPFAKEFESIDMASFKKRHKSPLTHGLYSQATDGQALRSLLRSLEELFRKEDPANGDLLESARFPVPLFAGGGEI